jgi:hypothetical protein
MSLFQNEALARQIGVDITGGPQGTSAVVLVPLYEVACQNGLGAASASLTVFISNDSYIVDSVKEVHGTASTSGTLQVEKATGTQAVGGGTNLLTGTVSLSAAANTVRSGTLVSNPNTLTLGVGDRLNLILAGTLTNLANCSVQIFLRRAS